VQTGKPRRIPIILVHTPFWEGFIQWLKDSLLVEGMINPEDLDLFQVLDDPDDVVKAIFKHYEQRGFEPSEEEQQIMLDL